MKIYGLYGKSGTGKSHKSVEAVSKYGIDAVIDDGILIVDKIHVAGSSAKNERLMYAAIKKAIFFSEDHRQEVIDAIRARHIDSMLIIGTSQRMILKIIERLELPKNVQWLPIEQLQTDNELMIARERRNKGYHVIPIRPIEVEKTYSGWFRKLIIRFGKRKEEVTLVKPLYTKRVKPVYLGDGAVTLHPQFIRNLIRIDSRQFPQLKIHEITVAHGRVKVVLSTLNGGSIHIIQDWRNHMSRMFAAFLGFHCPIDVEWKSFQPHK
jgi:hypothetical protein